MTTDKQADLAGPGIGNYEELEKVLPNDYEPLLDHKETMRALFAVKDYIEENLCRELNLMMVQVPLIVDVESGVNDMLDRDGSRTPIEFFISNDYGKNPITAQVVQAATKWKRVALAQFGMEPGEGLNTDMKAVRKDYFLDHDHSAYVDQWDWERVITAEHRNLDFLREVVQKLWKVIRGAGEFAQEQFPQLKTADYPAFPEELVFLHAEEILDRYPDLPRKKRETAILQEYPAIFIVGTFRPSSQSSFESGIIDVIPLPPVLWLALSILRRFSLNAALPLPHPGVWVKRLPPVCKRLDFARDLFEPEPGWQKNLT